MLVFISWCYKCPLKYFHKCFFFQAEDGIRDRSPSRGLGDVYKRQVLYRPKKALRFLLISNQNFSFWHTKIYVCLLIKSLLPKMNQTAKRNNNNEIKNNKELVLQ